MSATIPQISNGSAEARAAGRGLLIVNADDWGRDQLTTDRILDCVRVGSVSSASAMVFMEDSERAAAIAAEHDVDAGLHLNFTTPFSNGKCQAGLVERQAKLSCYLRRSRLAQAMFHPGLASTFEYVVKAQLDEFGRLYGREPQRLDGHHHMHLCANVLMGGLLPAGTIVRRSFSFRPGEKSLGNRVYGNVADRMLARRHRMTEFFFSLPPFDTDRLQEILSIAREAVVEGETHPVEDEEYRFLMDGEMFRRDGSVRVATKYLV